MAAFRALLKFSGYISLLALTTIMILWPFLESRLGSQNKMTTIGIALAILSGFVVYFDTKVSDIFKSAQHLRHAGLGDALRDAFALKKYRIDTLRIYALTTEVILPIIRDIPCAIENCHILLHRFDERGHVVHASALNAQVAAIRTKWEDVRRHGKIQSLEVLLYDDLPYEYEVILDKEILISGMYIPNDNSPHGNDFGEPCVFLNRSVEAARLIDKHVSRFDALFAYWKGISDSSQRTVTQKTA